MNDEFFPGDIFDEHYRLLDALSTEGGTADVWLAVDLNTIDVPLPGEPEPDDTQQDSEETGLKVAIKIYRPKNALDIEGEQRFRDEFKIVFNCHHSNLIQPTHFSIWQGIPYLVLPFCAHGSTEQLVGNLVDDYIWRYISDVSGGLAYLHARRPPIVHQDIKPANVLITDDFNYAITDFGISSTLGQRDLYDFASGTLAYMAPERFAEDDVPQPSSDVYAFGATLYELITGRVPFGEDGGSVQPDGPVQLDYGDKHVPVDVVRLIAACLDKDPSRRPTAETIHQAAQARTFPYNPRRGKMLKIAAFTIAAIVIAALGVMGWLRLRNENSNPNIVTQQEQIDPQQLFEQAMALAKNDDSDSIKAAFNLLDSIATHCNYMPAYYEIARTYGMVFEQDSAKYNRLKRALGVELGNINAKLTIERLHDVVDLGGYDQNIPKRIEHNNKANNACLWILSQDSPSYRREAMDAAWIMGCYSMLCTNDKAEAIKYFNLCRKAAQEIGDESTASIADSYIQVIGQLSLTK